jgi:flagellar motor switch/type III secretory pathway protein FliN
MARLLTQEELEALLASGPVVPAPVERLQIVIEAGRVEIPFGDLAALKPGSLLPLHGAAGDPMEVIANGTTVAYGQLTAVDGRAYVRIVSLTRPRSTTEERSPR